MAPKPGNVHRCRDLPGLRLVDFVASALAIAEPLDRAAADGHRRGRSSGAIEADPPARLDEHQPRDGAPARPARRRAAGIRLARASTAVLDATTSSTTRGPSIGRSGWPSPGGWVRSPEQDVADEPTRALRDVMALAADRDLVARQYANGFREVFDDALPTLARPPGRGPIRSRPRSSRPT